MSIFSRIAVLFRRNQLEADMAEEMREHLVSSFAIGFVPTTIVPEMASQDVPVIAVVTVMLLIVALLARWWPARRAARINLLVALRAE